MGDLNKVILCLQKWKSKNLGQNQDNSKSFLVKDHEYSPELSENLIDEAVQANIVKSRMFNGKISYRIVQIDSADDATISIKIYNKKSKNVVIIGDSMLNNINAKGLSKSKKFDVLNIPGATSGDIVDKIDDVLEGKPELLMT